MVRSMVGSRVGSDGWHNQVLPDRMSVRHGWAELCEHGRELWWDDRPMTPSVRVTGLEFRLGKVGV